MSYEYINKLETLVYKERMEKNKVLLKLKESVNLNEKMNDVLIKTMETTELAIKKKEELKEKFICRICFDNIKTIVIEPCCHFVSCQKCSDNFDKCPICRCDIESRLILF